jgi:hypothetical protein
MPAKTPAPRLIIEVFLYGIEPRIWRRFSIPADASFRQLHETIQQVMGWQNRHQHEFRHGAGKRLTAVIGPAAMAAEVPKDAFQDEAELSLAGFLGRRHLPLRMLYRYDFTDDWIHEVVFEQRDAEGKGAKPVLLDGARACPPEDCGGPWGYNQALRGELEWIDDDYDPEAFDPKKVRFK